MDADPVEEAPSADGDSYDEDDFYSIHLISGEPMRRIGTEWRQSRSRPTYATHHVFVDRYGDTYRIEQRDLMEMAMEGEAKRAHLRTIKAMSIASAVHSGSIDWPKALSVLAEMEPSEYRPGTAGDGDTTSVPEVDHTETLHAAAGVHHE
jgi:hypothetical protein